ncbi:hypothetical protein VT84_38940 [Gemmata sp. SH-PL17]|uniref:DUF6428 family protein n=1 Tax=Gemmata sp. SH-PL17 TaxID=1630693 RepID=UPI0004B561F9|nr:DUF6428 family protein [Gemmata sp. SH-PL17]AMV30435.1 hypothetical protein VT84_38940 [Gemmata sp. SH-PL17]
MNVAEFRGVLLADPGAALHLMLPDGDFVPAHFHVTEVGRVQKDFMDCGGTRRSVVSCLLQVWVANDTAHRLTAGKLASILNLAAPLLGSDDLVVEVEYERDAVSQFPVAFAEMTPAGVLFHLGRKHTDCLAPDKCGVSGCAPAPNGAKSGCC